MVRLGRAMAFVRKETVEVLRQPRLIGSLVAGPFLVLFAFGIGFSDRLPTFSTVFVAPEGTVVRETVDRFAGRLADYVDYEGVVADEAEALRRLREGEVDVVAVLPARPYEEVRSGHRATIRVRHDALDPLVAAAVEVAARLAADEINRQIVAAVLGEGQAATRVLDDAIPPLRSGLATARRALIAGDRSAGEAELSALAPELDDAVTEADRSLTVVEGLEEEFGVGAPELPESSRLAEAVEDLTGPGAATVPIEERVEQVRVVEEVLATVQRELEALQDVSPEVLVRPFRAISGTIGPEVRSAFDFYIPSVLVLLLQHLGVTFSSLSLVRERQLGTMELFRVSPLTAGQALLGKYLSYLLLGGGVAAVLTVLLVRVLGVPFAGDVGDFIVLVGVVLLGSLGLGFLISLVAQTDSQAVQLAMLVLLASFFFSGFFLSLDRLDPSVRWVSALLPVTHGVAMARDVVLRGGGLAAEPLVQGLALALGTALLAWRGLSRAFAGR